MADARATESERRKEAHREEVARDAPRGNGASTPPLRAMVPPEAGKSIGGSRLTRLRRFPDIRYNARTKWTKKASASQQPNEEAKDIQIPISGSRSSRNTGLMLRIKRDHHQKRVGSEIQDLKTSMSIFGGDAERANFTEQCKELRYRSMIGGPDQFKELSEEIG